MSVARDLAFWVSLTLCAVKRRVNRFRFGKGVFLHRSQSASRDRELWPKDMKADLGGASIHRRRCLHPLEAWCRRTFLVTHQFEDVR